MNEKQKMIIDDKVFNKIPCKRAPSPKGIKNMKKGVNYGTYEFENRDSISGTSSPLDSIHTVEKTDHFKKKENKEQSG